MSADLTRKHLAFHATGHAMVAMDVDYPDGASTGWHAHPCGQLLHAIEGVMTVRSMAGTWVVPPTRALWLAAGLDHEVSMAGAVKIRTVFIDAEPLARMPPKTCVIAVSTLLRELLVAAVAIRLDYALGGRDDRVMRLITDEVRVSDVLPLHLPVPQDPRVRQICEALSEHPGDVTSAAGWARQLGVTVRTVHRLFSSETGMTFARWREQARLLFALRRLAAGERIIDVAFDCGYASQSAFTAMFKRTLGRPPSRFFD